MHADYRKLIRAIGQNAEALRNDCQTLWEDNDADARDELADLITESLSDLLALAQELAKYQPHADSETLARVTGLPMFTTTGAPANAR